VGEVGEVLKWNNCVMRVKIRVKINKSEKMKRSEKIGILVN
jgi:hypothetical protein